jgi:LPXTG-motif cell wall-anchored protein
MENLIYIVAGVALVSLAGWLYFTRTKATLVSAEERREIDKLRGHS